MKDVAYGRLIIIAIGAFMASAAPEFDACWKAQHIPDTATFGSIMKSFTLASIEGIRAGIPAMVTAMIAFFMRQDSDVPAFSVGSVKKKTEAEVIQAQAQKESERYVTVSSATRDV
jgi:hypothetical protein